jgi:methylmalonyl-CoA mutase N-terminal domain/subunit
MREEFGAEDPRSWMLRFHAQTAGSALTLQQPDVNVARVALQALAAVLGGCQSLHTNARDEAMALPTEESARLALRTQQVIAHETQAGDVTDALGGSFAVEAITDEIEAGARAILKEIDDRGGMVRCIEDGWVQREIQEMAYRTQLRVESGEQVTVGVNAFQEQDDEGVPILRVDPSLETEQRERLRAFKERRDLPEVERRLGEVGRAAASDVNLLPFIVEAVDAGATLGEVSDALRQVFGTYQERSTL